MHAQRACPEGVPGGRARRACQEGVPSVVVGRYSKHDRPLTWPQVLIDSMAVHGEVHVLTFYQVRDGCQACRLGPNKEYDTARTRGGFKPESK